MVVMYDTNSGFQPTRYYKLTEKPKTISWKKLNKEIWEGKKHWLCFHLPEVQKTFNVYYPTETIRGEQIQLLINPDDCNDSVNEFYLSIYNLEWTEGKMGLFEQEIKPKLEKWIKKRLNKNSVKNI